MVVVLVGAQVLSQGTDALGEQRDLHVGRAGIASVEPVLLYDSGSVGLNDGHTYVYISLSYNSSLFVTDRSIRFSNSPTRCAARR